MEGTLFTRVFVTEGRMLCLNSWRTKEEGERGQNEDGKADDCQEDHHTEDFYLYSKSNGIPLAQSRGMSQMTSFETHPGSRAETRLGDGQRGSRETS